MSRPETWRPTASSSLLRARARLLGDIRNFFKQRDVLEVETPLLSAAGNPDPQIQSVVTTDGALLRTSPEFALKRLLAGGSGDIYELGRVFRAGESGHAHNPEFTLLEWYREGFTYLDLMDEVAALVRHCGRGSFDGWQVARLSYRDWFADTLGLDPFTAGVEVLAAMAEQHDVSANGPLERRQWLDLLTGLVLQPALPERQLTFVYDYPADQAALARVRRDQPPVAERFELYLGRAELANGYQELTDAAEQRRRFEADNEMRTQRGQEPYPVDHNLVAALAHGLPDCAGVALGVDRLLMALSGVDDISDVIAFPAPRA
jgi:lysyl-tRNA synthetase class 2